MMALPITFMLMPNRKKNTEILQSSGNTTKPIVSCRLSDKYLQECRDRALAADPLKADVVINDLRRRIYRLTSHIQKLQNGR